MVRPYKLYTDKEVEAFSYRYVMTDLTLEQLEAKTGISHSTMWICFQRRLANINFDLYEAVMKKLEINRHVGGKSDMHEGRTIITSKQDIETPAIRGLIGKEVKKNMIIWRFRTEDDAIRAGRKFMNIGFEVVRRPIK